MNDDIDPEHTKRRPRTKRADRCAGSESPRLSGGACLYSATCLNSAFHAGARKHRDTVRRLDWVKRSPLLFVVTTAILLSGCAPLATPPDGSLKSPLATPVGPSAEEHPTESPPFDLSAHDRRFVPIDSLTLSEDRRHISLTFVGAREFSSDNPCSADYAASTRVVDDTLEVGVFESRRPAPDWAPSGGAIPEGAVISCVSMGYSRSLEADLAARFDGRAWRDLYGYLHFLSAPEGLV